MADVEYLRPKSFKEIFGVVEKTKGRVKYIAGCTNIIPDMRVEVLSPKLLIDLSSLKGLSYIKEGIDTVSIGALTTISELVASEIIHREAPILTSAAHQLGNTLIRNRATVGGNLADASPAADMAPPLLALEALIHTKGGQKGERTISLDKFFLGPNKTVLEKGEILTKITFAKQKNSTKGSYIKLGLRNSTAISIVSIAVMLELKKNVCQKARVALGAVAPTPVRAYGVEKNLEGGVIDHGAVQENSILIGKEISPISDVRASAEYRHLVTSVLLRRILLSSIEGGIV